MTTNAFSGVGTVFMVGSGNTVSEINSITGPNITRDFIDVTSLDSTGGYREFIPSFRDAGELTLNCNYTVSGWDEFYDEFESETVQTFIIQLANTESSQFEIDGYVTGINLGIPMDDKVTMDVTIKLTGAIEFTS